MLEPHYFCTSDFLAILRLFADSRYAVSLLVPTYMAFTLQREQFIERVSATRELPFNYSHVIAGHYILFIRDKQTMSTVPPIPRATQPQISSYGFRLARSTI